MEEANLSTSSSILSRSLPIAWEDTSFTYSRTETIKEGQVFDLVNCQVYVILVTALVFYRACGALVLLSLKKKHSLLLIFQIIVEFIHSYKFCKSDPLTSVFTHGTLSYVAIPSYGRGGLLVASTISHPHPLPIRQFHLVIEKLHPERALSLIRERKFPTDVLLNAFPYNRPWEDHEQHDKVLATA